MSLVFFILYLALGAVAGWALMAFGGVEPLMGGMIGVLIGLVLGQLHLFASRRHKAIDNVETGIGELNRAQIDTSERLDVLESRTVAVETTIKHELTERRDALVTEMKQLESLIDRLSQNFEDKLAAPGATVAPSEDQALRAVKEALWDGRVDLHLQPVVSLPQRRVAFYEGFTRLRHPDGSLILPAYFLDAARRANLLVLIDNMTLFRCVQIVRRLAARDRRVGVFCNIASASLEDASFFPQFLDFMKENRDLAGAVIFEIRADRFETRSRTMRDNMDKLVALGFRFSLDHAASLDLDLPRLQDAGVRYVKIGGEALLANLREPSGPRPASAVQRPLGADEVSAVFSRYGVTLVAEKLEDEMTVLEVLEYDVPFGQGHVFGAPRPIKSSLMEETAPPQELLDKLRAAI